MNIWCNAFNSNIHRRWFSFRANKSQNNIFDWSGGEKWQWRLILRAFFCRHRFSPSSSRSPFVSSQNAKRSVAPVGHCNPSTRASIFSKWRGRERLQQRSSYMNRAAGMMRVRRSLPLAYIDKPDKPAVRRARARRYLLLYLLFSASCCWRGLSEQWVARCRGSSRTAAAPGFTWWDIRVRRAVKTNRPTKPLWNSYFARSAKFAQNIMGYMRTKALGTCIISPPSRVSARARQRFIVRAQSN